MNMLIQLRCKHNAQFVDAFYVCMFTV